MNSLKRGRSWIRITSPRKDPNTKLVFVCIPDSFELGPDHAVPESRSWNARFDTRASTRRTLWRENSFSTSEKRSSWIKIWRRERRRLRIWNENRTFRSSMQCFTSRIPHCLQLTLCRLWCCPHLDSKREVRSAESKTASTSTSQNSQLVRENLQLRREIDSLKKTPSGYPMPGLGGGGVHYTLPSRIMASRFSLSSRGSSALFSTVIQSSVGRSAPQPSGRRIRKPGRGRPSQAGTGSPPRSEGELEFRSLTTVFAVCFSW